MAKVVICMMLKVKLIWTFLGGIAVNALGYAHPVLVKALSPSRRLSLTHCSNIFYTDIQAKAVKLVSEVTGFDRVFFANSGAEANEGAMKLASKYGVSMDPCKYKIISVQRNLSTAVHLIPWQLQATSTTALVMALCLRDTSSCTTAI
jgi:hypothetical protein